jgi:hypothetical protein
LSTKIFIALLFSSQEYTREEGQNYLYTARVAPSKRFDLNALKTAPIPEISALIAQLNTSVPRERILAASQIFYLGIRTPELRKNIQDHLKAYSIGHESMNSDEAAWMLKALSAMGEADDKKIIAAFADSGGERLRFHAGLALALVDKFSVWYEQINSTDFTTITETQLHQLLFQAPYLTAKDAAIHYMISKRNETQNFVDQCYTELKLFWPYVQRNAREVRPNARMMQVMARSPKPEYAELLREIVAKAPSKHLVAHAQENLAAF